MAKLYSVEVLICATAYIRAESPEEAAKLAQEAFGDQTDASTAKNSVFGDVDVSGLQYNDPNLPKVSLSPAMAFVGRSNAEGRDTFVADDMDEVE